MDIRPLIYGLNSFLDTGSEDQKLRYLSKTRTEEDETSCLFPSPSHVLFVHSRTLCLFHSSASLSISPSALEDAAGGGFCRVGDASSPVD